MEAAPLSIPILVNLLPSASSKPCYGQFIMPKTAVLQCENGRKNTFKNWLIPIQSGKSLKQKEIS